MHAETRWILQLLGLSVGLSLAIKYGGPLLALAPTAGNALLGTTVLPVSVAAALLWRWRQYHRQR